MSVAYGPSVVGYNWPGVVAGPGVVHVPFAPSLQFNFLAPEDPSGLTYTLAGGLTYFDSTGTLQTAAANVWPLDHDPATLAPRGRPVWSQRTNVCLYSGDLAATGWTGAGIGTSAGATAPDGTSAYTRLTATATTNAHEWFRTFTSTSGTVYTMGAILRSTGSQRWVRLQLFATGLVGSAWFDLDNGVWGTISAGTTAHTVENLGGGEYRVAITATASGTGTGYWTVSAVPSDGFAGAWLGTGGTFDAWAAQMEAGAFPTPYIPTAGSAATRNAPSITAALGSWFNATQGTIVASALKANSAIGGMASIDNGTFSESYYITLGSGPGNVVGQVYDGGVAQAALNGGAWTQNAVIRAALAYQVNDFALSRNGSTPVTDASGTLPTPTTLRIGQDFNSANNFLDGWMQTFAYYPSRLPNPVLQTLTA